MIIITSESCRNLTELFASDPECVAKRIGGDQRAMQFAGAKLDDEFDMKKLQVQGERVQRRRTGRTPYGQANPKP